MLSFEQYSLSFKNTRSKLTNLDIITYIKRESKENSRKFKKKTRSLGEEQYLYRNE